MHSDRHRLTNLVIEEARILIHSLTRKVGIGSRLHDLVGREGKLNV